VESQGISLKVGAPSVPPIETNVHKHGDAAHGTQPHDSHHHHYHHAGHHAHKHTHVDKLRGLENGEAWAKLEGNKRIKFKEFRRGYEGADKTIDASNPEIRRRCKRLQVIWMTTASMVTFGVGIGLLIFSMMDLAKMATASRATCKIYEYATPSDAPFNPLASWKDQCSYCAFVIQVKSEEHGLFMVNGWTPEFGPTYQSEHKAVMTHEQFKCCPTESPLDCCQFYHEDTASFCDNFGSYVDTSCPVNPWTCHFFDLEEKLSAGIRPEDLHVGDTEGSYPLLLAGIVMTPLGTFLLLWFGPCFQRFWHIPRVRRMSNSVRLCIACFVPDRFKTEDQWRRIDQRNAAIVIQRWWKAKFARIKARRQRILDLQRQDELFGINPGLEKVLRETAAPTRSESKSSAAPKGPKMFGDKSSSTIIEEKPQATTIPFGALDRMSDSTSDIAEESSWAKMCAGEKMVQANRFFQKFWEAERNPQVGIPLCGPAPPAPRLIYDTGSAANFRKLGNHRQVSGPFDKLERIEVIVSSEVEEIVKILRAPHKNTKGDTRYTVGEITKGTIVESMGLAPGLRLQKVGKLQFPNAAGDELMQALREGPKPVVLMFEGSPRGLEDPPFVENWPRDRGKVLHRSKSVPKTDCPLPGELQPPAPPSRARDDREASPKPPKELPPTVPAIAGAEALTEAAADALFRLQTRRSRLWSPASTTGRLTRRGRPSHRPSSGPTPSEARRGRLSIGKSNKRAMSYPLEAGVRDKVEASCMATTDSPIIESKFFNSKSRPSSPASLFKSRPSSPASLFKSRPASSGSVSVASQKMRAAAAWNR